MQYERHVWRWFGCVGFGLVATLAVAAQEEAAARDTALVPLFNGADLSGWHNVNGAPSTWRVEDGMIVCSGLPTGVLRTERQYENFVFEVEWRHLEPNGNAGIFVWSDPVTARGQPFTRAVEVQVMDGKEGDWYTTQGDVFPIHGATMVPHNGRGGMRAFPKERRSRPSPEWNHYRIQCLDGAIELAVNGKVVTTGSQCSPRKGYLCLESEGSPVHFRNLRLKELPPSEPALAAEHVAERDQGFVSLYNGVDLAGWKVGDGQEHWVARNWCLAHDGAGGDLRTEKSFGDVMLICDWRWTGKSAPDELPEQQTAGARVALAPVLEGAAESGQWNRLQITMRGPRRIVVLNGVKVAEDDLPDVPESGPIALQGVGAAMQFANVYVRELN